MCMCTSCTISIIAEAPETTRGRGGRLVPEGTPATGDVNVEYTYRQTHDVERERPCPFIKRFLFYLLMPLYIHRTVKVKVQMHHITLLYADAAKSNTETLIINVSRYLISP